MEFELSLIIPVYNDINRIASLLKKIELLPFSKNIEVIVVDNNSDDGTYEYLNTLTNKFSYSLFVLKLSESKKEYDVFKTGISYANGRYIVTQRLKYEYEIEDIKLVYEKLLYCGCDVVFTKREKGISFYERLVGVFLNFLFNTKYYDIYSPIKGFKKEIIKSFSQLNIIDFDIWIILNIYIKKISVFQLEIKTFLKDSNSYIIDLFDTLKIMLLILKFRITFFIKRIW